MSFVAPGVHEGVKALFHGAFLTLAVIILLYNLSAWWTFGDWKSGLTAVVYAAICLFELCQTVSHLRWIG